MGERKQRWRNTKIITFLPNRPFPHSTPVTKHKKMRLRLGWTISYKSLYFVHPCLDLMPLFTGMRERSTHSCITAVKKDVYDVENTAGNARWCNLGSSNFHPRVTGLKCSLFFFLWQNFQPTYQDPSWKNWDLRIWASPHSQMNISKM